MKKTNASPYKLAIIATSLVMVYFASGIASIAQSAELLKAEPILQINLIKEAQDSLKVSFSTLVINNESNVNLLMAKQEKSALENKAVNLSKKILISE